MALSKKERKQQKRKLKKKQDRLEQTKQSVLSKAWYHYNEAYFYYTQFKYDLAEIEIQKAFKLMPDREEVLGLMSSIGIQQRNYAYMIKACEGLENIGKATDELKANKMVALFFAEQYSECIIQTDKLIQDISARRFKGKKQMLTRLQKIRTNALFCQNKIETENKLAEEKKFKTEIIKTIAPEPATDEDKTQIPVPVLPTIPVEIPQVPLSVSFDSSFFLKMLSDPEPACSEEYELSLLSHIIRFTESFETLICLSDLKQIQSLWYQEETAKKVLKQFRGRALLSDEVGLGKTIEALIILSEYIKRGMVKTGLILTPSPLVSQWKEEMSVKFNLDVPSTDDPCFSSGDKEFWNNPIVVASINQAKSPKNIKYIAEREYDIIIVDEAHHLKNSTTQNWKLLNTLKKRFILLLTATPVENNLMELYNLITLLKPGQLETASSFKERFMKKGDPTDPQNRTLLKELLSQVMIRNTRAIANIRIPPRYAQTIRIEPTNKEKEFFGRIEDLVMSLNEQKGGKAKMLIKSLLAQAGSSPKAVENSLDTMLGNEAYLKEYGNEIRAVKNLCHSIVDTPKNMALLKLIQANKEKIIVFAKYKGTVEHLKEFLEWYQIPFALFHGSMSNARKDEAMEAFRNNARVLVTTEIGGEGHNIQFCSRMVNYDLPWNPMKIEQRIGRIHRIGQEKEVYIYNFCSAGTIEDYILDILDRKINMFEMVIGEIDMIVGRVSGEKEFSDMVCDIWLNSQNPEERESSFAKLGTKMKRARTGYEKTRELDEKLFGDTYEL